MNIISINSNHVGIPSGKKVLSRSEYQTFYKGSQIVKAAENQAAKIEKEAKKAFKAEKQRGFDEGMMESRIEQSEQMLKMVDRTINYLAEVENTMADILMSAVKKIIDGFDDKDMVVGLIKSALQYVRNQHEVTVRVPPSQFTHVKEKVAEILADYKGVGFINPVSDPRLEKGSCILESKIGVIDASIDIQMEALQRRFSKLTHETMGAITKSAGELDDDAIDELEN